MKNKRENVVKRGKMYEHQATCTESDNMTTTNKRTQTKKNGEQKKTYIIQKDVVMKKACCYIF